MTNFTKASVLLFTLLGCANGGTSNGGHVDLDEAYLDIVGDATPSISERAEIGLSVRYVDGAGAPIEGGQITWTIEDDAMGASLSAELSSTDQDGMANITLRAGTSAIFTVRAVAPVAEPADIRVTVTEGRVVDLAVTPIYEGERNVTDIDVALFTNASCADFGETIPAPRESERTRTWETVHFANVDTASPDAVYAIGYNSAGNIAASRCLDVDHENLDVTFELVDITAVNGGRFATVETFDVTEGMPAALDDTLAALEGLSTDPGGYLVDLAIASGRLPGWVEGILSLSSGIITNLLESAMERLHVPGYVTDLLDAGGNVNRAFTGLVFVGSLNIGEADEFGEGAATHRLVELHVPNAGGEYDVLPLASEIVDVSAEFADGEVTLGEHDFAVSFGEVIETVLEGSVLPAFPGSPRSMGELISGVVPCDRVADALLGESDTFKGAAEAVCQFGTEYLGELVTGWVTDLFDYDTLTLAGVGSTTDTDQDYFADEFVGAADASWSGTRGVLEFEGVLEGNRDGERPMREADRVAERLVGLL